MPLLRDSSCWPDMAWLHSKGATVVKQDLIRPNNHQKNFSDDPRWKSGETPALTSAYWINIKKATYNHKGIWDAKLRGGFLFHCGQFCFYLQQSCLSWLNSWALIFSMLCFALLSPKVHVLAKEGHMRPCDMQTKDKQKLAVNLGCVCAWCSANYHKLTKEAPLQVIRYQRSSMNSYPRMKPYILYRNAYYLTFDGRVFN